MGTVELDGAGAVDGVEKDIVGVITGFFFGYEGFGSCTYLNMKLMLDEGSCWMGLHTVDDCCNIAGFVILALRGMPVDPDRDSQLKGLETDRRQGRRNINGRTVVIAVSVSAPSNSNEASWAESSSSSPLRNLGIGFSGHAAPPSLGSWRTWSPECQARLGIP